jgi:hypothetical protein
VIDNFVLSMEERRHEKHYHHHPDHASKKLRQSSRTVLTSKRNTREFTRKIDANKVDANEVDANEVDYGLYTYTTKCSVLGVKSERLWRSSNFIGELC